MDEQIRELLTYFQTNLRKVDDAAAGLIGAAKATYPMVVVGIGDESRELHSKVKQQLLKVWPPYRDHLLFLQTAGNADQMTFSELDSEHSLSEDDVQQRMSSLFEESHYFKNYTKLLVFFILDTTECADSVDLQMCLAQMRQCEKVFCFDNASNVLLLTLNERIGKKESAARLRREYSDLYFKEETARDIVPCTYIVSNKNAVGSFMPGMNSYFHQIFTDIILLCNSSDPYISSNMLHSGVKTVGFNTQEKPVEEMAKASLSALLKKINDLCSRPSGEEIGFSGQNAIALRKRLGIREDGTFQLLDSYVESVQNYLPTNDIIEAFPRRTCNDLDLYTLSVSKMEEETFGAWGCYIEKIASKIEQDISSGFWQNDSFEDVYLKYLQNEFTRGELIWMKSNIEEIAELLNYAPDTNGTKNVIDSLKVELGARVFRNTGIRDAILEVISTAGQQASQFTGLWRELANSASVIVEEPDTVTFFDNKVQQYVDTHQQQILSQFQLLNDQEELIQFLYGEIRSLIKSDPIFTAPFHEVLLKLAALKNPTQALQAIANQLCGAQVKVWLAANGTSLDAPVQRALLMQEGTDLYDSLHRTLSDQEYYYYDTDVNESADALDIYILTAMQLMI